MAQLPKDKENEAFYREVDEELRRAQMQGFFQRFGKWIIAGVVLLLAAVAAVIWWQHYRQTQAEEQGQKLTAVLQDIDARKVTGSDPRLDDLAKNGNEGYRAAALLAKAGLATQAGRDAEAIATYGSIADDDGFAQPYRDVALIRRTMLEFDKLPPATVVDRLRPLATKGNPWFGSAGELVALAYLKQGKPELAGNVFAEMARDDKVPESIRSRAREMAGSLGVDVDAGTSGTAGAAKDSK